MSINYKHSEETKLKISKALKGRLAWNKGKKCPWVGENKRKYFNVPKACITCGKIVYRKENETSTTWINRKYCSLKCAYEKNIKQGKICKWCKKFFYAKRHRKGKVFLKKEFCNIKCVVANRENNYKIGTLKRVPSTHKFGVKENNINWKNGITPVIEKIRKSKKYKRWRNEIFERDRYTCQDCLIRGGNINAHHIKKLSDLLQEYKINCYTKAINDKRVWDLKNGVTFCEKCHRKTF